ncbi:MAG: hypothetical protein J5493_00870 [Lachnospiraceae bacterium]|nr:hypothetical protein [Lachnospiraceae bacterium]
MSVKNEAKGIGFAVLRIGLVFAAIALIAVLVLGFRSHSSRYTKDVEYTDMDPMMANDETLPEGEFGKVTVRWILGSYASEEKSLSVLGIPFKSGEYQYYLVITPDLSLITIRTSDKDEIAQLEALADQYGSARTQKQVEAIPGYEAKGKIEKIKEKELKQYYDETLDEIGFNARSGMKKSDLLIDSSAIPGRNVLLFVVLPIAGLVILAIVGIALGKRRKQAAAAAQAAVPEGVPQGVPAEPGLSPEEEIPEEYRSGIDL